MAVYTINLQATQAAPNAYQSAGFPSSAYSRIDAMRMIADNDNASAAVRLELVVSRSSTPLSGGTIVAEDALTRRDPLIFAEQMNAGGVVVHGQGEVDLITNRDQLLSDSTFVGIRAVGLESSKVCNVQLELETSEVSLSANRTTYLEQLLRFQEQS